MTVAEMIIKREVDILAKECVGEDGQLNREKLRENQEYINKLHRELIADAKESREDV